jgi:hypothetical protein
MDSFFLNEFQYKSSGENGDQLSRKLFDRRNLLTPGRKYIYRPIWVKIWLTLFSAASQRHSDTLTKLLSHTAA